MNDIEDDIEIIRDVYEIKNFMDEHEDIFEGMIFNWMTADEFLKYCEKRYPQVKWHTEIIYGISGNLFSIFSTLPIFIFISDYAKQKIDWKFAILYVITACSTISWLFLMKNHSYVHTHLNYILWYFGFIQVCFYIVVKKCYTFLKGVKE